MKRTRRMGETNETTGEITHGIQNSNKSYSTTRAGVKVMSRWAELEIHRQLKHITWQPQQHEPTAA